MTVTPPHAGFLAILFYRALAMLLLLAGGLRLLQGVRTTGLA